MITKRTKVSLVLFFLVGLTCAALWLARSPSVQGRAPSVTQADAQSVHPFTGLDRKAKAAKGADAVAIRDLTEDAFTTFAPTEMPSFTQEAMKDRVARAEVNYRIGADKGIPEFKVAKTVNELADKLEIPDYAKVSPAMVRIVRLGLMMELPNFIAQDPPGDKEHKKKLGSSINPFMSPLEATAVTMFLLQQKLLNEAFQVSHKEFFANLHEKQLQKWEEWRAQKNGTAQPTAEGQPAQKLRVVSNSKRDNARRAAKRAAEAMSPDALLNLADSSLDTLGIKR
jgi:hypothetical protein